MSMAHDSRSEDGPYLLRLADRGRVGLGPALLRRLTPSYRLRVENEGEYLARLIFLCVFSGTAGTAMWLVPVGPWSFWVQYAVLGAALSAAATMVTARPLALDKSLLGALSGLALAWLVDAGYTALGLCTFGAVLGMIISDGKTDRYQRLNTILASALAVMLGAWAVARLGSSISVLLPPALTVAMQWAIIGLFISIAAIPLHLTVRADPVLLHVRKMRKRLKKQYRLEIDDLLDQYLVLKRRSWRRRSEEFDSYLFYKSRLEEAMLISAESSLARQKLEKERSL